MSRLQSRIWFAITVVFAVCLTVYALYHIAIHPWRSLPELGGDGGKNCFTFLWHSLYDKGYWFRGMNYPYGEHIVFADGIPVISTLLNQFTEVTPGVALTTLWWLIALSYVLSIIFLYKTLLYYKVHPLAAMFFAGLIGIFTPQLIRLRGHYALSFVCIIPMLFYWTIKHTENNRWRYPLYFFIMGCIMAFIHPYYAGMMFIWVIFYSLGIFLVTKTPLRQKFTSVLPLFSSVIAVLLFVALVMKLTDPVTDRPQTPFASFYETCTHIKQIVTSAYSPFWQKSEDKPRWYFVSEGGEGYTYLGFAVELILIVSIIIAVIRSVRKKRLDIIAGNTGFSPVWLFMAFGILLFSMGVPFIWHMAWLMDYLSVFRQFRSFGRFSWIFYYIVAIYSVVVLYATFVKLKSQRKSIAAYAVLLIPFLLWCYEASGYLKFSRHLSEYGAYNYDVIYSTYEQNWESFLHDHGHQKTDFQGLLLLPFVHNGTEKLWVGDAGWLITLGVKSALQLQLPIVDVMMSRSSWSQAEKQVKIAGGPLTEKPLLEDVKSNKPFLLLRTDYDSLNPDQKYLLQAADYIGHFTQTLVYCFYPDRLRALDKQLDDRVAAILPFVRTDTVIGGDSNYFIEHYASGSAPQHFFGNAHKCIHGDDSVIANIPVHYYSDTDMYELSAWFLLGKEDYRSPTIHLDMFDAGGARIDSADVVTRQSTDNYGMWFRAATFFKLRPGCQKIRCRLNNDPNPAYIAMDELELRNVKSLVISKASDGSAMVDNHRFPPGK